jgi:hypothetical protein
MNQVKFDFDFQIFADLFGKIGHISQTVYQIEVKFYREILNTLNYIVVKF